MIIIILSYKYMAILKIFFKKLKIAKMKKLLWTGWLSI